jgi:splicing factor 3A subunit 2
MANRDYDIGGRTGGGEYNAQLDKIQRASRVSALKLQEKDLTEDQHLFRNQYGNLECKLCCTSHKTEASYIAHTYGKAHQRNVQRRRVFLARKEAILGGNRTEARLNPQAPTQKRPKIGNPGFSIYRTKDSSGNLSILFELTYEEIRKSTSPKYRIMSAFEQTMETPDPQYQYVLFAAQPYNTVAFKIPNLPVMENLIIEEWRASERLYTFQVTLAAPVEPGQ